MADDGLFEGKLFVLRSQMNSLVLDVEGNNASPGSAVKMWTAKEFGENDNQIWYEDYETGTIRSFLNDLCLEFQGDGLVLNDFEFGNSNQQWNVAGDNVINRENPNLVLDIANGDGDCGARVCGWEHNGGNNQQWTPEYLQAKFFFIRSKMCDKVLDVEKGSTDPGTHVVLYEFNGNDNQMFYEDRSGVIRAKINKFALDGSGEHIKLFPYESGNPAMQWIFRGENIVLRDDPKRAIDIEGGWSFDETKLVPYDLHGESNQCFTMQYA